VDHAEARDVLELAAVEPGGLARLMAGDTPEAAALAGHLAGCAECTQEMARLRRVAGIVRGVVRTTPPPELRERTLAFVRAVGRDRSPARAATAPAATALAAGSAPAIRRGTMVAVGPATASAPAPAVRGMSGWRRFAAIAAVVALAVAGTSVAVVQSLAVADRDATIRQQAEDVSDLATVTAWTLRLSAQPDARRVALTAPGAPNQQGTLVFSPATHDLVVVATGLSQPPAGQEFRCWVESGGSRKGVGKMFFGGGIAYWVGPAPVVSGLSRDATFGVSLVDLAAPGVQRDPVLVGEL
jgi:hypothetical protein